MSNNSLSNSVKIVSKVFVAAGWESPIFTPKKQGGMEDGLELTSFKAIEGWSLKLIIELMYAGYSAKYLLSGFSLEPWRTDRQTKLDGSGSGYGLLVPADLLTLYRKVFATAPDTNYNQDYSREHLFIVTTGRNLLSILEMYDEFAAKSGTRQLFQPVGKAS